MTSCIDLAFGFYIEHFPHESVIFEEDTDTGEDSAVFVLDDQRQELSENQRNRLAWQWLRERAVRLEAAAESLELFLEEEMSE